MELTILTALDWRLDAPKAHDFLGHFLLRLPFHTKTDEIETLRVRSEVFIDMSFCGESLMYNFVSYCICGTHLLKSNLLPNSSLILKSFPRADKLDPAFVAYGPAVIAASALFCAISGIEGESGTAPMYDNIPPAYLASCFGLVKCFPTHGDRAKLVACVENIKLIFRSYNGSSGGHQQFLNAQRQEDVPQVIVPPSTLLGVY